MPDTQRERLATLQYKEEIEAFSRSRHCATWGPIFEALPNRDKAWVEEAEANLLAASEER